MTPISRRDRFNICLAGLPGLMHFGRTARHIPVLTEVTGLRLEIPLDGIRGQVKVPLHLDALTLLTGADLAQASPEASMSSVHAVSGAPGGLLTAQPIHTVAEPCPWWEVRFGRPVPLAGISVLNRNDVWSWRAYALRVIGTGPDGQGFTFDNLDADQLLRELDLFLSLLLRAEADLDFLQLRPAIPFVFDLVRQVEAALNGVPTDLIAMRGLRLQTLAALAKLVQPLDTWQLRLALSYLAPILEALIDRAFSDEPAPREEAEVAALALASYFLHHRILNVRYILENEKFLKSIAQVTLFEDIINGVVERVEGPSSARIMFRAHHISSHDLRARSTQFLDTLDDIIQVLHGFGYEAAICYGTLLGAVREKTFIAHDDDVDIVVTVKGRTEADVHAEMADLAGRLRQAGMDAGMYPGQIFMSAGSAKGGERADIFPIIERENGQVGMYMEHLKVRDVPRSCVLPFAEIEFLGRSYPCPQDPAHFLSERYGSDWNVPVRYLAGLMLR